MNARDLSNRLADLLRREHGAFADFLLALADFDRRRAYEELGHASLFVFLHRELGLSKGSAYYRKVAAELVQRCPEIVEPLRDGRLCVTSVVELAKVLTPENRAEVLPRFFHRSRQEAKAITAELRPQEAPARRDVLTVARAHAVPLIAPTPAPANDPLFDAARREPADGGAKGATSAAGRAPVVLAVQPLNHLHANSVDTSWAARPEHTSSAVRAEVEPRPEPPRDVAEPLTADLRRLHVTVSRRFLAKLEAAREALSHAKPRASTEDVLEAALDLLLEKTARRRSAAVKKRRAAAPKPPAPATAPPPRHIPAAVRREVWSRDQGRCTWPLASGGICGSTRRLELDHVTPVALGGSSKISNLRILCDRHNRLAARRALGDARVDDARQRRQARPPPTTRGDGAAASADLHFG